MPGSEKAGKIEGWEARKLGSLEAGRVGSWEVGKLGSEGIEIKVPGARLKAKGP
jgi:hypothetical protein